MRVSSFFVPIVNPHPVFPLTFCCIAAYTGTMTRPGREGLRLVKAEVLDALEKAQGGFLSGQELADRLAVSRTAVWKAVAALRADGLPITAVTNRGYALPPDADLLHAEAVTRLLDPVVAAALHIEVYDRLPGTNAALRARAAQGAAEGLVCIAQAQSAGRGRQGRSFYSPPGGLYMSILLRPEIGAHQAVQLTVMAAVAAAKAAEEVAGVPIGIKWVNDLWRGERKICGILTEAAMDVESGLLDFAVVGPGFNLVPPPEGWPAQLAGIAGSLFDSPPPPGTRARLAAAFLNHLWPLYRSGRMQRVLPDYRARQVLPGRRVMVCPGHGPQYPATVLGVDDACRLVVQPEGAHTPTALYSGEVRLLPIDAPQKKG